MRLLWFQFWRTRQLFQGCTKFRCGNGRAQNYPDLWRGNAGLMATMADAVLAARKAIGVTPQALVDREVEHKLTAVQSVS